MIRKIVDLKPILRQVQDTTKDVKLQEQIKVCLKIIPSLTNSTELEELASAITPSSTSSELDQKVRGMVKIILQIQEKTIITPQEEAAITKKYDALNPLKSLPPNTPQGIIQELLQLNRPLKILEDKYNLVSLKEEQAIKSGDSELKENCKKLKNDLRTQYEKTFQEKVSFVKKNFPDNPIYAMANVCLLPKNSIYYTALRPITDKSNSLKTLLIRGPHYNPEEPATGYHPKFKYRKGVDINEMGEQGKYFSLESLAYLSPECPIAVRCSLSKDIEGVSICAVSELLSSQCNFNDQETRFTEELIEKGYKQLIIDYPFLQHDGLYPRNTEVVFLNLEQALRLTGITYGTDPTEITGWQSLEDFCDMLALDVPSEPLHKMFVPQ